MFTDNRILFDIITCKKTTTERRLMIDLEVARDPFAKKEISIIAPIDSAEFSSSKIANR